MHLETPTECIFKMEVHLSLEVQLPGKTMKNAKGKNWSILLVE